MSHSIHHACHSHANFHTMVTTDSSNGNDLLTSIALVRQLLKEDPHIVDAELSAAQRSHYETRLRLDEEQKAHREFVQELRFRLDQAKNEAQQERAIRVSLEETNSALEQHAAELSALLESRSSFDPTPALESSVDPEHAETIKKLEREKTELNSKLLASQKDVGEARTMADNWKNMCHQAHQQVKKAEMQLETIKKEYEIIQKHQKILLQGKLSKYESFRTTLEESIAARRSALDELQSIKDTQPAASASTFSSLKQKHEEALAAVTRSEEKVARLETEIAVLKQQGMAPNSLADEEEQSQTAMKELQKRIAELNEAYTKTKNEAEALEAEVPKSDDKLSLAKTKIGEILDRTESCLKELHSMLKKKVEACDYEFTRIREELKAAKAAVQKTQLEISDCQKKRKEVRNLTTIAYAQ
jgi:chromosome segregation ATPase